MSKRGSKCPDCNGPHGRGYYTCTAPYANMPVEMAATPNYAEIEARVMAHYSERIGAAVYEAMQNSRSGSITVRVSLVHDELTIEPIDM